MRTFVIGDIHGHLDALIQCLERSGFDKTSDRLICLGDVCDRGNQVLECIDLLLTIPNLVYLIGNHDYWTRMWLSELFSGSMSMRLEEDLWLQQGGKETKNSITKYGTTTENNKRVLEFLEKAVPYHVENRMAFVHGGIEPDSKVENNSIDTLMWDRRLVSEARYRALESDPVVTEYDLLFCGHTPTLSYNSYFPIKYSNVWMIDTGVCYEGCLTIMNIDTKEYFQSDIQPKG